MAILASDVDLSKLNDMQLASLVRAAVDVLAVWGDADLDSSIMAMSTRAAAQELAPVLHHDNELVNVASLQGAFEDIRTAKHLCIVVLKELRNSPELALAIDEAYAKSQRKMSTETVLLVGAVVLLAIKIKEIKHGDLVIKFDQCSKEVKGFLASLVTKIH